MSRLMSSIRRSATCAVLAALLLTLGGVVVPQSAFADVWWSVSLTAEVIDGQGAPAQGVPVAYSFDDWLNPDEGVMVTGPDGTVYCRHWGSEDNGFVGGFTLALDDPHGVYSLLRTESDGFFGDEDNAWLHKTYYLADAGAIAGVVRDASGLTMQGVGVELYLLDVDGALERVVETRSDTLGHYRFAGLSSRSYAVRFSYGRPYGPRFWGGAADPVSAGLIALGQDEVRLDIDGEPGPPLQSSLAGQVVTRAGSVFPGVVVRAWLRADDGSLTQLPAPALTDERGAYVVEGLVPGTYTVSLDLGPRFGGVRWLGGARDGARASFVTVGWDDHVDGLDFVVPRGILRGSRHGAR